MIIAALNRLYVTMYNGNVLFPERFFIQKVLVYT